MILPVKKPLVFAPLVSPGRPPVLGRYGQSEFWKLISQGLKTEDAGKIVGASGPVALRWFRHAGGVKPQYLEPKTGRYLSFAERELIALYLVQGKSVRFIAKELGRCASTISREIRRNAGRRSNTFTYTAVTAQWHATRAASRPKQAKLVTNQRLYEYVFDRLAGKVTHADGTVFDGPDVVFKNKPKGNRGHRGWSKAWSPGQISKRLVMDYPDDPTMRISHEAIYQSLYIQSRGALKRELTAYLRTNRTMRVPRARVKPKGKNFITADINISQHPPEANDRAIPGHWEGDLIIGGGKTAIGTLVERSTRFVMLLHLPSMAEHGVVKRTKTSPAYAGHGTIAVKNALVKKIGTLPEHLRRSLTWDQGAEMAAHAQMKIEAGCSY